MGGTCLKQAADIVGRQCLGKIPPLIRVAALLVQELQLLYRFNTFGHHFFSKRMNQADDAFDQVKKDAKEVGKEVGDIVNEAADKARSFFESVADKAGAFIEKSDPAEEAKAFD